MTMSEIQNLLTTLMRGIDKKTLLLVEPRADSDHPGVMVHLSCEKRSGSLGIAEAELIAAQTDLMRRNRLRSALKRTRDQMWAETGFIFSTKLEHQKGEGMQSYRPQQRGRGGRR